MTVVTYYPSQAASSSIAPAPAPLPVHVPAEILDISPQLPALVRGEPLLTVIAVDTPVTAIAVVPPFASILIGTTAIIALIALAATIVIAIGGRGISDR